jgi:hypothetical protein
MAIFELFFEFASLNDKHKPAALLLILVFAIGSVSYIVYDSYQPKYKVTIGDKVYFINEYYSRFGVITFIDDSGNQVKTTVLTSKIENL